MSEIALYSALVERARTLLETPLEPAPLLPAGGWEPTARVTATAVAAVAGALRDGEHAVVLALVVAAVAPNACDMSAPDAGALINAGLAVVNSPPAREGAVLRDPAGRYLRLADRWPDAWGCDVLRRPGDLVAEGWIELESEQAALSHVVQ